MGSTRIFKARWKPIAISTALTTVVSLGAPAAFAVVCPPTVQAATVKQGVTEISDMGVSFNLEGGSRYVRILRVQSAQSLETVQGVLTYDGQPVTGSEDGLAITATSSMGFTLPNVSFDSGTGKFSVEVPVNKIDDITLRVSIKDASNIYINNNSINEQQKSDLESASGEIQICDKGITDLQTPDSVQIGDKDVAIQGILRDGNDQPVSGATVVVFGEKYGELDEGITDTSGHFKLTLSEVTVADRLYISEKVGPYEIPMQEVAVPYVQSTFSLNLFKTQIPHSSDAQGPVVVTGVLTYQGVPVTSDTNEEQNPYLSVTAEASNDAQIPQVTYNTSEDGDFRGDFNLFIPNAKVATFTFRVSVADASHVYINGSPINKGQLDQLQSFSTQLFVSDHKIVSLTTDPSPIVVGDTNVTISGKVLDGNNNPVAEATIGITDDNGNLMQSHDGADLVTTALQDGSFSLQIAQVDFGGSVYLGEAAGVSGPYVPLQKIQIIGHHIDNLVLPSSIHFGDTNVTIRGQLLDAKDQPVRKATIGLYDSWDRLLVDTEGNAISVSTDDGGAFVIKIDRIDFEGPVYLGEAMGASNEYIPLKEIDIVNSEQSGSQPGNDVSFNLNGNPGDLIDIPHIQRSQTKVAVTGTLTYDDKPVTADSEALSIRLINVADSTSMDVSFNSATGVFTIQIPTDAPALFHISVKVENASGIKIGGQTATEEQIQNLQDAFAEIDVVDHIIQQTPASLMRGSTNVIISGKLVDGENQPVIGARVELDGINGEIIKRGDGSDAAAITRPDGSFSIVLDQVSQNRLIYLVEDNIDFSYTLSTVPIQQSPSRVSFDLDKQRIDLARTSQGTSEIAGTLSYDDQLISVDAQEALSLTLTSKSGTVASQDIPYTSNGFKVSIPVGTPDVFQLHVNVKDQTKIRIGGQPITEDEINALKQAVSAPIVVSDPVKNPEGLPLISAGDKNVFISGVLTTEGLYLNTTDKPQSLAGQLTHSVIRRMLPRGAVHGMAGAAPLPGVSIGIYDENGTPMKDVNGVPLTTTTGNDGSFSLHILQVNFDGLAYLGEKAGNSYAPLLEFGVAAALQQPPPQQPPISQPPPHVPADFLWIQGNDRYETSIGLLTHSSIGWTRGHSDYVIIVNGIPGHEVDALAANSLAGALGAPVMVVNGNAYELTAAQKQFLSAVGAKRVFVVGLPLNGALESKLQAAGLTVNETDFHGNNRYDTANRVARHIRSLTDVSPKAVFVARGDALPDALSVGSLAAGEGDIVLLRSASESDVQWQESVQLAEQFDVPIYVLGGNGAIPESVVNELGATRIAGSDRYETNLELFKQFSRFMHDDTLYLANGSDAHLVDALSAGSIAGQRINPILLINGSSLTDGQKAFLQQHAGQFQHVVFVGGSAAFSDSLISQVEAIVGAS